MGGNSLPGTWMVQGGSSPAPTVKAGCTVTITPTGQARVYPTWVQGSDPMNVIVQAHNDDYSAIGAHRAEVLVDNVLWHTENGLDPTATLIEFKTNFTKAQIATLSVGSHTLEVMLYDTDS